jgi:imidazolonepropionase-like amidohydrolase
MNRTPRKNFTAANKLCAQFLSLLLVAIAAVPTWAQPAPAVYAIKGGKIYTLAGPAIENGTVVIRDGKIAAVGTDVEIPAGAQVIDAAGLEVYPGLFDPVTQLGLTEVGAVSATVDVSELGNFNPELVAATAVNPASAHIAVTRASGITHVIAAPGAHGFEVQSRAGIGIFAFGMDLR